MANPVIIPFLADGTWVSPAGYSRPALVEGCGGGGGGGGARTNAGAGGGGGSLFQNRIFIVDAGVTHSITIGAGGGGGAANNNGSAGVSSFVKQGAVTRAELIGGNPGQSTAGDNAPGGTDGIDSTFAKGGVGRAGTNPSGTGGLNILGTFSGGANPAFNNSTGGAGGAGPYGAGANGNPPNWPTNANGESAGANTGAGAGGGTSAGGLNGTGGTGGSGRLYLIYWPNDNVAYQQFASSGTWRCPADIAGPVLVCSSTQDNTGKLSCRWVTAVPGTNYSITTTSALGETWSTAGTITVVWFPG